MKILIISNMYPSKKQPEYAPFIKNIEMALIENGAEVSKIVIAGKGQSLIEKAIKYGLFYFKILCVNLKQYDIIHLSYPSHTYWPLLFKRLSSAKLVVRLHGEDLVESKIKESIFLQLGRKWFTLPSLRRAKLVVVPSNYFREELKKTGVNTKAHIYPSGGVNRSILYPNSTPQKKDLFTIGFVGRLGEGKGIEYLLEAVKNLTFPHKVLIIGNGPLKESLIKRAQRYDLKNVEFLGAIPNQELRTYYNQMDVFVFPTIMESFGNVGIEAMACGIPVIGSGITALKEYIKDGSNGYLFDVGNVQMLTKKISAYHSLNKNEQSQMKKEATLTAEKYDKDILTTRFIKELFSLTK